MRIPYFPMLFASPFDGLQEHAEKVKECAWVFQQAIECHVSSKCKTFEDFRRQVIKLESEADTIKQNIREHLPKGTRLFVDRFKIFMYLREQDQVLDAMEDVLDWISYRSELGIPEALEKDFFLLVDSVINPVEDLNRMVLEARKYFAKFSERQRVLVKGIVRGIREKEHEADKVEHLLKGKILNMKADPVTIFHLFRLAEIIGSIADHAENTGDMMRSMLAR
jgi:predicted phosphate transport protein (TIGR00153 family)